MAEDFQANNWWKTSKSIGAAAGDGAPFSWIGGAASQLPSPSMDWGQTLLSSSSGRDENSFQVMLQEDLNSSAQLKDMNHPFFFENSIISSGESFPLSSSSSSIIQGLIEPDNYQHSQFINNNTPFWNASGSSQPFDLPIKSSSEPAMKKIRVEAPSTLPTFKVRKEKLGDRITALQQLVSPFGKTDTASVLHEAIEYIKFLHEQVNVLSTPYLKNGHPMQQQQQSSEKFKDGEWKKKDLRSRGLCLVPISSTYPVATETTADFWTPTFGGTYR